MSIQTKDGVTLIQSKPVFHLGRWVSAIIVGLMALGLAYILVTNDRSNDFVHDLGHGTSDHHGYYAPIN